MSMQKLNLEIVRKLQGLTNFQRVYGYPIIPTDGYPSATVTPTRIDSDYETRAENLRTYGFVVRIFQGVDAVSKSGETKIEYAYNTMRSLVDTVVDTFDQDETLPNADMPSDKTIIQVVPIPITVEFFTEDKIIMGEVRIDVLVSVDVS